MCQKEIINYQTAFPSQPLTSKMYETKFKFYFLNKLTYCYGQILSA